MNMELEVVSMPSRNGFTLSRLFVDGVFTCFVCEDVVRELQNTPVEKWKVPGATAIPSGRYEVLITPSQRFGYLLPLLVNVPGFAGVRIHPGNTAADTEGCLLPGQGFNTSGVTNSRVAFDALFAKLSNAINAGEKVFISIKRA